MHRRSHICHIKTTLQYALVHVYQIWQAERTIDIGCFTDNRKFVDESLTRQFGNHDPPFAAIEGGYMIPDFRQTHNCS